jgi:hypothetical protein
MVAIAFILAFASLIMIAAIYLPWWLGRVKGRKPKLSRREMYVLAASASLFLISFGIIETTLVPDSEVSPP